MPRAFLIRSRSAFPTQNSKKENLPEVQDQNNRNAQSTGISEHFMQDFSSVDYVIPTTSVDHITPADDDVDRRVYAGHMRELERSNSEDEKPENSRSSLEIPKYRVINTKINQGGRKKSKRALETQPGDITDNYVPKKVRKGQPKKTVVYYYETAEETQARESNGFHKVPKDESGCGRNYTHDKRHYANEHNRYQNHEASQSPGTSSDNFYSSSGGKQTGSFAMQNSRESLDQEKAASKGTQKNNEVLDKNAGLENIMIVEYHSMSRNQDKRYRANEHKSTEPVTQQTSRGYYLPPRSVHTTSYSTVTTNVTTSVPAKIQPPQTASVPAVKQESETKVVYVPVFPVSRGPNGIIYEAIPNATPIMAKDTVQVQPSQPEPQQAQQPPRLEPSRGLPQQPHRPEPPRAIPQQQIGQEVIVRPVLPSPSAPQNEPRIEYRAYEPHMPQQLTATPAPGHQSFQPHQGHVMVQQQTALPYPSHTPTVVQVPQYQASRPHYKQQYQPRAEHPQTSHAATVPQPHNYRPKHQTVSVSQPPNTRGSEPVQHYQHARPVVPVSQTYHEVPGHQYTAQQSQPQHHNYQREEITIQRSYPSPVNIVVSAPQNMYPDRVNQPRPPPLPSQPQHVEKPALPSPSYPQESANRQLTPRYTPDGVNHRHKFVYAPPPDDFMNSPVYRVPNNEENSRNEAYYNGKVGNKSGSKKRKSSLPSHAVMPRKIDEHQEIPSPVESNSRSPSPKETDLRCNERLVKSPNRPSTLIKSSLVITPPVSPTEGEEENIETVTVVVRDQGIQASPKDGRSLEHTCYKRPIKHMRSGSYHSESSEEEFLEDDNCNMKDTRKMKAEHLRIQSDEEEDEDHGTYTADGTLVVRIPYSETNNLKKQHRAKRGNYRFVCRYCNKGFQWHSHLESHERTHTGEKPFKCPECDRAFCRADGLQCHMLVHNKKRPYKCPYCGKGFNDKIILEKHIYSHTGVKPFKCEYCGRAFSDSLSIEKHLLVHTGSKPYKCPYCVRSFNDSQMLVRHIRSHTGEKPFKCKHCPMAFSKQSALIIHTRVHTGEKPYQCPHCIKSFSISGNLQRHILIHTGERPYKCSKCPKAFNNPSHLSRHISKLHAPQPENAKEQIKYEQFQPEQPYHSPPEVV